MADDLLKGYTEIPLTEPTQVETDPLMEGYDEIDILEPTISEPISLQERGIKPRALESVSDSPFETAVRVDQGDLNWALQTYKGVSPEVAAKVNRISKEQEINFESAMANKTEWGEWQEAQDIYNSILEKDEKGQHKYPYVANWLADPDKMAINKDDVTALKELENEIRIQARSDDNIFQKQIRAAQYTLATMNVALAQTPAAAYTTAATLGGLSNIDIPFTDKTIPKTIPFLSDNPLVNYYKEQQEYYFQPEMAESFFKQIGDGEYAAAAQTMGLKVSAQIPNMLVAMGAFATGQPNLGLQVLGTISGVGGFSEALGEEKTAEQAVTRGLTYRATEMMFETVGTMRWMKSLMDDVSKNVGKAGAKQFMKTLTKTYASTGLQEGLEELGTEVSQVLTDIMTGSDVEFGQALERVGEAFIVGIGSGGGTSVSMTTVSHISQRNVFRRNTESFNKMEEAVEKIKTNKTDPSNTKEFIDKQVQGQQVDPNVYFNSEEFAMLYQEKPEEVDKLVKDLGITKQVAESNATGEDIAVNKADLLAQYTATDILEDIKKFMAFTPSGITVNNEKIREEAFKQELERANTKAEEQLTETELPEQVVTIRNQLMESGQKAEDVDAQLAPLLAGAKTLSQQTGEIVDQWFERVNPRVQLGGNFAGSQPKTLFQKVKDKFTKPQTETKSFKKWFGDSKVVDEGGEPLVVYHGTNQEFETFDPKKSIGQVFWFSENRSKIESGEAGATGTSRIIPVYLSAKKLAGWAEYEKLGLGQIEELGFDGVRLDDDYIIFNPTQIKSVDNQGTFDSTDPNIFRQEEDKVVRGAVQFTTSETIINMFESANMSTFLHESFHVLENDMTNLIKEGKADEQLIADYETLVAFADGKMDVKGREKLARGFEAYLREGKAPSVKLARAFDRFKQWLTNIYRSLANLDVEINDEIRGVFDRLLASEQEINEAQSYYEIRDNYSDLKITKEQKKKMDKKRKNADMTSTEIQAKKKLQAFERAIGGRNIYRERATKEIEAMPVYMIIEDATDRGGLDPDEIRSEYGQDTLKALRKHKGLIFTKLSDKKATTYQSLVLDNGGINPNSLSPAQKKELRETGTFGVMRNTGRALDELAEDLVTSGDIQVPVNKNKDDYLFNLIKDKIKYTASSQVSFLDDIEGESLAQFVIPFGYESEELLVDNLTTVPTKSQAIILRTQELQNQVERDILADQEAQETIAGEESIHNDASFAFNVAEAQLYRERVDKKKRGAIRSIEGQALKDEAHNLVYNKKVKNAINYSKVAASEQAQAKRAVAFAQEGKFEEAVEEKRRQTLSHAIVQESVRARDEKLKIEERYKTKKIEPKLKNTENDFANIAIDLMRYYELNNSRKILPSEEGVIKRLEELDETLYSDTPDWILQGLNQGNYRELTMNQLVELNDTIVSVLGAGNKKLKGLKDTKYETTEELKDDSLENMNELPDKRIATDDDSVFTQKRLKLQEAVLAPYEMVGFVFERLDNYKLRKTNTFGALGEVYNALTASEVKFKDTQDAVVADIKPSFDILNNASRRLESLNDGRIFDIEGVEMPDFMTKAGKNKWTAERVIAFVLNMGNESNLNVLRNSFNYTDEQINKVAAQLTEEELQAIQNIWDSINKLFPQLDQAHFNIYNRHLAKVEPQAITINTTDGKTVTLEGGYYPLQYDTTVSVKALQTVTGEQAIQDEMKNRSRSMLGKTTPKDGFKYARQEGVSLPPKLDLGVLLSHINDTSRYISHAEILRDLNALIRNREWAEMVIQKQGRKFYTELKKWASYQASPQRSIENVFEAGLDKMRSLSTTAILGLNIGVSLLQRFSTIQALSKISGNYLLQGMKQTDLKGLAFGTTNSASYQSVVKLSGYMRTRENNFNREIGDIINKIKFNQKTFEMVGREFTVKDLQKFAFTWIQMMDRATVVPIWKGAYQKFMDENVIGEATDQDIKDAVTFADDVIEKTQPSTLPVNLNSLQRSEGILRLFTSFMTFTMKLGNIYIAEHKAWRDGAITNEQYFRHVMLDYMLAGVSVMVFRSLLYSGEIPELWEFITAPFEQLLGTMPFARDIPGFFRSGRDIGSIPAFRGVNQTLKAIKSTGKGITGDKEWDKVWLDIGKGLEVWAGITPVKSAQDIKRKYENIKGLLGED